MVEKRDMILTGCSIKRGCYKPQYRGKMNMADITDTTVWHNLQTHYESISTTHLRDLFLDDNERFENFSIEAAGLFLDYSKNHITQETQKLLIELANSTNLEGKITAMFAGEPINNTEHRAALHTALRNRSNTPILVDNEDVMPKINKVLDKIHSFTDQVREGKWLGYTGKPMTDIVNIGIGGSDLGPKMVCCALKSYASHLRCHFISNIDGTQIIETLQSLNPETTLFCIASKTFTTLETLTNANTAKSWLLNKFGDSAAVAKHFVAISTNTEKVRNFGIDTNNMFEFWDWVGGRYSVWSAIGLSIALLAGMENFEAFLDGAHTIDQHFQTAPFDKNMPVILALLGLWHRNFFNFSSHTVIPYDQYLQFFSAFLQQLDMESNGKSIQRDTSDINYQTGPVIWGGIGTDGQHAFHQLLHQGTSVIPVDFIIPLNSLNPIGKHHDLLFANCLAQSQALLQGKTTKEAYQELIAKGLNDEEAKILAKHKTMPGNRPSNTILFDKLTPKILGALIALYEHKVFVQGVIWNINSFDQWGVELGKQLANKITPDLTSKAISPKYDCSTKGLIEKYR